MKHSQSDDSAQMVVIWTIKETTCLVLDVFDNIVDPFCVYICDMKFFVHPVCFNLAIATKAAMSFHKSHNLFQYAPFKSKRFL